MCRTRPSGGKRPTNPQATERNPEQTLRAGAPAGLPPRWEQAILKPPRVPPQDRKEGDTLWTVGRGLQGAQWHRSRTAVVRVNGWFLLQRLGTERHRCWGGGTRSAHVPAYTHTLPLLGPVNHTPAAPRSGSQSRDI